MRLGGAPFAALGAMILIASCGLGTAGLSGDLVREDASANRPPDATSAEGSSPAGDADAAKPDASDLLESATEEADDGARGVGDSASDTADAPTDANAAGEAAIGGDAADSTDGEVPVDAPAGGGDAGDAADASDAANDIVSASDAGGSLDATADEASSCDDADACLVVPNGWSLIAFAPTQASDCPSGFGQSEDLVEGPDAASACGCGACGVTTQPSCGAGPIQVFYDSITSADAGTCGLPGSVSPLSNAPPGSCLTDLYQGDYSLFDLEYVPSSPSGGVCATPGAKAPGNLTYAAQDRICTPSSSPSAGCNGTICAPALTGPYAACITAAGDVACPAGPLSAKHLVGTTTSFDCSPCSCTVTGTCSGTVTLYSDTKCHAAALPVPADGSCNNIAGLVARPAPSYNSYMYQTNAPTQVGCDTSGSSTSANVALTGEATVCCAP